MLSVAALGLTVLLLSAAQSVDAAEGRAKPAPEREAENEDWASDSLQLFAKAGVRVEVPRVPGGRRLTRYQLAVLASLLLEHLKQDLVRADERWAADLRLTWADVDPPQLRGQAECARWLMERLRDRSLLATLTPATPTVRGGRATATEWLGTANKLLSDVLPDHPDHKAVVTMALRGMFIGYPDATFRGDRELTPRELAVTLHRFTTEIERLKTGRCYARKTLASKPATGSK
jgi:hypothetical protein